MFFSFDGIDGVGKSTQVQLFCDELRVRGFEVVACRDPGSTQLGERIREVLLSHSAGVHIDQRSEMLLYMAARAQLVDEVIRPALEAGSVVVSDRFVLANVVYQGHGGGLDPDEIWRIGRFATNNILPDCVFLLDMPPEAADSRLDRPRDRLESRGADYRRRLRDGFLAEAAQFPQHVHVIDAARPIEPIRQAIWQIAANKLKTS
jgi:dTMP kinase